MVLITIVTGAYKPTYNWDAHHFPSHFPSEIMSSPGPTAEREPWASAPLCGPRVYWHPRDLALRQKRHVDLGYPWFTFGIYGGYTLW